MSNCQNKAKHVSVLLHETLEQLPLGTGMEFVDGTLGGGGHAEQILLLSNGKVTGIDQDSFAIAYSKQRLAQYGDRVRYVKDNFSNIKNILLERAIPGIDGAVLDLGVSSFQLDDSSRGFSYMQDAPIDMRMDTEAQVSAYDVVNEYAEDKLREVIYKYGEERFGGRIASAIVRNRPIESTLALADVIKRAIPAASRRKGPHPAKRTFQAIRIEVNLELEILERALVDFIEVLNPGGVLAVISFHSLEDRIVKNVFRDAQNPCTCPPDFPVCVCGKKTLGKVLTRKPIIPCEEELEMNPRARSAKLRAFTKIDRRN